MLIGKGAGGGGVEGRKDFLPIHVVHVLINVFAAWFGTHSYQGRVRNFRGVGGGCVMGGSDLFFNQ